MNELLAPCGDYDSFVAAINAGCDAIYLGLESFSARKRAKNFSLTELEEVIKISHKLDVKVFVATNTLILDRQFSRLVALLDKAYLLGCDAFIVQDIGLMKVIANRYKDIEMHISTQVNVTNKYEALFFKKLKASRIVLAREVSLEEATEIKAYSKIAVEIFIHGALCVSYSGNCLFSSSIGPRSGNLGDCAQPCRKRYKLIKEQNLLQEGFLLSTKDLCTINYLQAIKKAHIDSLKIEGRLKSKEYVFYTTNIYKKELNHKSTKNAIDILKVLYNRKYTKGYLLNEEKPNIMNCLSNNHQGLVLGYAMETQRDLKIKLEYELSINDGIRSTNNQRGYIVKEIYLKNNRVKTAKKGEIVVLKNLDGGFKKGDKILITKDSSLKINTNLITRTKRIPVLFRAYLNYMSLEYEDIIVSSDNVFRALKHANTKKEILNVLTKTGHSYYRFDIDFDIENDLFINNKDLKLLKQTFIKKLDNKYLAYTRQITTDEIIYKTKLQKPTIAIQIETEEQYNFIKNYHFDRLYIRNEKLYHKLNNSNYYLVTPRVINNRDLLTDVNKLLVSDYTYLESQNKAIDCSSYMNIYNSLAVKTLLNVGVDIIYLSYELKNEDILEMPSGDYLDYVGVVLYSKYDVMLTKNNLLDNFYNIHQDVSFNDHYFLQDGYDNNYPLVNEGDNLRIVDYKALDKLNHYEKYLKKGIKHYKIDFTNESKAEIAKIMEQLNLQ